MIFKKVPLNIFLNNICLLLFLVTSLNLSAQRGIKNIKGDEKNAKFFFEKECYLLALNDYYYLYLDDSTNVDHKYHLAICYLNTNIEKHKAIPLLKSITSLEEFDHQTWYDLGRAYQYAYQFNDAIDAFKQFLHIVEADDDKNDIPAERQIQICQNAKELTKDTLNVHIENLGSDINSAFPDYNVYVTGNEAYLVFTSKRQGNIGNLPDLDGYNTPDIYSSEQKYCKWSRAKRFTPVINTNLAEECVGLSADGNRLLAFFYNETGREDIYYTNKKGRSFQKAESFGEYVNSNQSIESAAAISPDNTILFFASNRDGGMGKKDIYYSKKLPNGIWGPPVNLGVNINTSYNEDFPYLSPDGTYLYFCSQGHNTIGGYDIFKCRWNVII